MIKKGNGEMLISNCDRRFSLRSACFGILK
jgi:hypothetical protein